MTVPSDTPFGALETDTSLSSDQIEAKARELLAQLTLDEKLDLMSGEPTFWFGLADMMWGVAPRHAL